MITDHLPDWVSNYVNQVADELQVPSDTVAVLAIGALSAAVNGGATTRPTSTWAEPVCLYTLGLLSSGEGKSPIFNRLMDPVTYAYQDVTGVAAATDALTQQIRNEVKRDAVKAVRKKCMRAVAKGEMTQEEAVAEIREAERQSSLFQGNHVPLVALSDATPAALIDALKENEGRVVIASPEAEGLLQFNGSSKEAILKGFDGDTLAPARRGQGKVVISRPAVTCLIAMQPTILGKLGADMVNRGLMPRFLISYPDSKVGFRESRPKLVTEADETAFVEGMKQIVSVYAERVPKMVWWNSQAVKEIGLWRDEIEPLLAPGQILAPIAAWASKVRGAHFIRLAALLAICENRDTVTVDDCTNAKAILRSLMVDARRAFGEMGARFVDDDLTHLMYVVQERLPTDNKRPVPVGEAFAKREVMRKSNRLTDPKRAQDALDRAVEEGLLGTDGKTWWALGDDES